MDKTFKTYDELLCLLESRNISFQNDDDKLRATEILKQVGYYNLINGYKDIFLSIDSDGTEVFKTGTTIDEIYALYEFDRELRDIFFKRIVVVETHIKSLISYEFSKEYGHDNYLVYNNFDTERRDATKNISALIAKLYSEISNKSNDPSILHYLNNYGYIPLWVLNNILTLGTVSKFYSLMKQTNKQAISSEFNILDKQLESMLKYLSAIRNFCAHGNRLYCYRNKSSLVDTDIHKKLNVCKENSDEYLYGKRDLFACVIALKYLMDKNDFQSFIQEIEDNIEATNRRMKILTSNDLFHSMGFPDNWSDIADY